MKSVEMSGKTVEDAIKAGLKELGCDSADVAIDVIDLGSPGLFGMFGRLARVKLTMKEKDPDLSFDISSLSSIVTAPTPEKRPAPRQESKPEPKPAPKAEVKPEIKPIPRPEPTAPKPEARPAVKAEPKPAPRPEVKAESVPAPRPAPRPENRSARPANRPEPVHADDDEPRIALTTAVDLPPTDPATLSEIARDAYDFLTSLTSLMGVTVDIRVQEVEGTINIQMSGDTLGILIGRRGDTLDALQYLTSLKVNKHREGYVRVSLDTEHYRVKREEALVKLASRMATRARRTGGRVALEPMNPYERRVLHSALQDNPYVTTHSEGEDPYRRVIITLKK